MEWSLWVAAAALAGCGALAFLPENWFGVPAWRRTLEAAPAIHLPTTITTTPWETGFWLAVLGLSSLIGIFCLTHPIRSQSLVVYGGFAAASCGGYAALAMFAKRSGWHYPFDGGATFGFFPNRNHTATLLVTGSVVSMGLLRVLLRERRVGSGLLAAISLTLCLVALFFFSASRGGVVFLLTGLLLWVGGLGRQHRDIPLLVSLVALSVAVVILFLISGSEVRNRLLGTAGPNASLRTDGISMRPVAGDYPDLARVRGDRNVPADFRWVIYRDACALIRDYPFTGIGLGAFAYSFTHYRRASLSEGAPIHPESDWLMLVAEAGGPALACVVALAWLTSRRLAGLATHFYWPLRWGFIAAAGSAVLHGVVDVPIHRIALGWWVMVLVGLGLQVGSKRRSGCSRWQQGIFILAGLGAIGLGTQLVRAEWFGGLPLPPFAAESAQREITRAYGRKDILGAMNLAARAVRTSPMSAPLYYSWGVLMLHFEDSDREVDEAFQAQRLLNPTWPVVPLQQGDAWAAVDQKRTAMLWLEAWERKRRIERAEHASSDGGLAFYVMLLERARNWPVTLRELSALAEQSPAYTLAWVKEADPGAVHDRLGALLAQDALRRQFTPDDRERLLLLWQAKGNHDDLERFVGEHSDWLAAAWPVRLRGFIDAHRYEEAVLEVLRRYDISLALPPPGKLEANPVPLAEGSNPIEEFQRYWRGGNTVSARRVLLEAADSMGQGPSAAEYWRLRLALDVQDGAWPSAWAELRHYLELTHPEVAIP